jgi:hypothetical protein
MTRLRIGEDVGVESTDGGVYLARLPDGPIVVLHGTAAEIWAEACDADRATLATRVAVRLGTEPDVIADDVSTFLNGLLLAGLLVEVD